MDLSWSELLIVGIVAVVVIGKDLPGMFHELGRFSAKIRAMGREFSRAMEAAAKESGVKDVAADLKKATSPKAMGLDAMKSAADKFEKWDPLKPAAAKPAAAAAAAVPAAAPAAAANLGPATAALAEKVAERKIAAAETTARLKAAKAGDAAPAAVTETAPAAQPKRGGRVRKKPKAPSGDDA